MKAVIYRRIESLFGLVPSFLRRPEDAGEVIGWKPRPKRVPKQAVLSSEPVPQAREGSVVCHHGPIEVRRPVGGDRAN